MTTAFISEAELRTIPGLDLTQYTSATISGMCVRATVLAENFLDYSLAFEAGKVEKTRGSISSEGDIWIFPKKRPIIALNSAAIKKGSFNSQITLSGGGASYYDIIDDNRINIPSAQISLSQISIINWRALRSSTFWVEINYDCGWYPYDRPQDIVEAVLLYARDLFSSAQNTSGASELSQGAVTIKYADTKGKSEFVKDAESILMNYKASSGW